MLDQLADLCQANGWDYGLVLESSYETAWSASLRLTKQPNAWRDVDRSQLYFAAGGQTAEEVAQRVLQACLADAQ